jgi:hypothetical protein
MIAELPSSLADRQARLVSDVEEVLLAVKVGQAGSSAADGGGTGAHPLR